jgi:prepilin-type processing-associated H-X9-DG protein
MKPRRSNQSNRALTQVEVLVNIVVAGVLMFLAVAWLFQAKRRAGSICCNCNLKQIVLSFKIWEDDHGGKFPMQTSVTNGGTMELTDGRSAWIDFAVISNELSTPIILVCPADKSRLCSTNFAVGFNNANVSYFVGLDASESQPAMFLSGDENFAIDDIPVKSGLLELSTNRSVAWTDARHKSSGNIGLVDGSVQLISTTNLQAALYQTGLATNRLALP